jgi:menaquinone reductase, molybdopterin-binding-like subunit
MDRRDFLKITAVTSASATLSSCSNPELQMIRFIPEDTLSGGIATWRPSICPLCPTGCGMVVRVLDGEAEVVRDGKKGLIQMGLAKKLEGNPSHPVSQGKLCVRGQASIQLTYHPDRIAAPLKRIGSRGSGTFEEITWDEAISTLVGQLDFLSTGGNAKELAFLTKPMRGQRPVLISRFLDGFGAPPAVTFDPFDDHVLRQANLRSFGHEQLPTFDLARSRYVIAFGADFLGTWNSPVSQSVGYGDMRQGRPGQRGKFVQVEARMSQTGANADEWVPVVPGTEGVLALGLAHVILKSKLFRADAAGRAGSQIEGWSSGLTEYAPDKVSARTGVKADRIERIAREFAENLPAVAIIGGTPMGHTNAMFSALAVNALNALLGSLEKPGGMSFMPQPSKLAEPDTQPFESFLTKMTAGTESPVKVLLLHDANPVYGSPQTWKVRDTFSKIPFIASFGSFIDETSILSDLILPDHSFLESWVDHVPESGAHTAVVGVAPPVMRPLHQTRAIADVLLDVSHRLKKPLSPELPWKTYEEILKGVVESLASGPDAWKNAKLNGGVWELETGSTLKQAAIEGRSRYPSVDPQFDGDGATFPFHFLPYKSQSFLDGSLAHLPWLQELPDVLSTAMWSSWVEIHTETAKGLGLVQGDVVEIASSHGAIHAPVLVSPGIAPNIIAMPMGQGHDTFTRFASKRGANPISILAPVTEPETGAFAWAATRVRVSKVKDKSKLNLFAGGMREHPEQHR